MHKQNSDSYNYKQTKWSHIIQHLKQRKYVINFKYHCIKTIQYKIQHCSNGCGNDVHKYGWWIQQTVMLAKWTGSSWCELWTMSCFHPEWLRFYSCCSVASLKWIHLTATRESVLFLTNHLIYSGIDIYGLCCRVIILSEMYHLWLADSIIAVPANHPHVARSDTQYFSDEIRPCSVRMALQKDMYCWVLDPPPHTHTHTHVCSYVSLTRLFLSAYM